MSDGLGRSAPAPFYDDVFSEQELEDIGHKLVSAERSLVMEFRQRIGDLAVIADAGEDSRVGWWD
jgi:hypothetical protein